MQLISLENILLELFVLFVLLPGGRSQILQGQSATSLGPQDGGFCVQVLHCAGFLISVISQLSSIYSVAQRNEMKYLIC